MWGYSKNREGESALTHANYMHCDTCTLTYEHDPIMPDYSCPSCLDDANTYPAGRCSACRGEGFRQTILGHSACDPCGGTGIGKRYVESLRPGARLVAAS